ncbi:MAG TPA: CarD family transcriptional regulator [Acidimicrobiales bacterium]|nr:CarD family transcriptional regulator [Acidimicrobiales bacterium]
MTQSTRIPALGDVVLHAHHGPLDVVAIVKRGGEGQPHLHLRAHGGGVEALNLYVPVDRFDPLRFRSPVSVDEIDELEQIVNAKTRVGKETFARRFKNNESRLAANDPFLAAQVVRDLSQRPTLSAAERDQLREALRRLNAEIEAVTGRVDALRPVVVSTQDAAA